MAFQRLGPTPFPKGAQRLCCLRCTYGQKDPCASLPSHPAPHCGGDFTPAALTDHPEVLQPHRALWQGWMWRFHPITQLCLSALEHGSSLQGEVMAQQQTACLGINGLWPQKASRHSEETLQSASPQVCASQPGHCPELPPDPECCKPILIMARGIIPPGPTE